MGTVLAEHLPEEDPLCHLGCLKLIRRIQKETEAKFWFKKRKKAFTHSSIMVHMYSTWLRSGEFLSFRGLEALDTRFCRHVSMAEWSGDQHGCTPPVRLLAQIMHQSYFLPKAWLEARLREFQIICAIQDLLELRAQSRVHYCTFRCYCWLKALQTCCML